MNDHVFQPGVKPPEPEVDLQSGLVKAWSYSALTEFEKCGHRTYLSKVKRIKTEKHEAAERGTTVHELAEAWIKSQIDELPTELNRFKNEFYALRARYPDAVQAEDPWAFDVDWNHCDWWADQVWVRVKLDALVWESPTSVLVIDFKTGKKDGNEIAHTTQAQLYAIGTFMRYPVLEHVEVEFWYLDKGQKLAKSYARDHAMMFLPRWTERGAAMTTAQEFTPKPSKYNCMWCPFAKEGVCEWAHQG